MCCVSHSSTAEFVLHVEAGALVSSPVTVRAKAAAIEEVRAALALMGKVAAAFASRELRAAFNSWAGLLEVASRTQHYANMYALREARALLARWLAVSPTLNAVPIGVCHATSPPRRVSRSGGSAAPSARSR